MCCQSLSERQTTSFNRVGDVIAGLIECTLVHMRCWLAGWWEYRDDERCGCVVACRSRMTVVVNMTGCSRAELSRNLTCSDVTRSLHSTPVAAAAAATSRRAPSFSLHQRLSWLTPYRQQRFRCTWAQPSADTPGRSPVDWKCRTGNCSIFTLPVGLRKLC